MIKSKDIQTIQALGYDYITSIGKDTIRAMCRDKTSYMDCSLFDTDLKEFVENNTRYTLRWNPIGQEEIRNNREEKIKRLQEYLDEQKEYYNTHYRAKKETIEKRVNTLLKRLKLEKFISLSLEYETKEIEVFNKRSNTKEIKTKELIKSANIVIDKEAKEEVERLDGCYVVKHQ